MKTTLAHWLVGSLSLTTVACSSNSKGVAAGTSASNAGTSANATASSSGAAAHDAGTVPGSSAAGDAAAEPATSSANAGDAGASLPSQSASASASSAIPSNAGTLIVDVKRLFMAPGDKDRAYVLRAVNAQGDASSVSVSVDASSVVSAAFKDGSIALEALADGHAQVDVATAAGAHSLFDVYVSAPRAISVKDQYQIGYVDSFDLAYSDGGTGCTDDATYWKPKPVADFLPLGLVGRGGYDDPSGKTYTLVARNLPSSDALMPVTDATQLVAKRGFKVWRAAPAAGYVALSDFILPGDSTDYLSFALVREDLTRPAEAPGRIWRCSDFTDGALETYDITPKGALDYGELPLVGHWMVATGGSFNAPVAPVDPALHVLVSNVNVTREYDLGAAGVPRTTTLDKPSATDPVRVRAILVPFNTITDAAYDDKWKVANSPWYRLERRDYYAPVLHRANLGTTDLEQMLSYTVGITQTASETFSQSTSVTVSAQFGIALGGLSAGGSISVTQELGYERMMSNETFTEHMLSETITVPPTTVMTVWQLETRMLLQRFHAGVWETVGDPEGLVSGSDSLIFTQEAVE